MPAVKMYATAVCPYCQRAEQLLRARGVNNIEKILIDQDPLKREEMRAVTNNARTVPQIFIGSTLVGGFDDLSALDRRGELKQLLQTG